MKKEIKGLIEISQYYGKQKEYVIAGGGNTSFKDNSTIYIKASGTTLGSITEEGFAVLDRKKVKAVMSAKYSDNPAVREFSIKKDLLSARLDPESALRPSVETSLHEMINYKFVVHTHPTLVNAVACSKNAAAALNRLFGAQALFVKYIDPGYTLAKYLESELAQYRKEHGKDAQIIFLQNHGVFVAADSIKEIKALYKMITDKIKSQIKNSPQIKSEPVDEKLVQVLPAIRMSLSDDTVKTARVRRNSLISHFLASKESAADVSAPFTPDNIVYCKAFPLFINENSTPEKIIKAFISGLANYRRSHGYAPKIILIRGLGLIAVEDSSRAVGILLDTFEDMMKIAYFAKKFSGPRPMSPKEIDFIDNWEVENYRRKVSKSAQSGRAEGRSAVITGAAQGFGEGIARDMFSHGANLVIADINEEKGRQLAADLNAQNKKNTALFVKTDVTSTDSIREMINQTVLEFGGLDIIISNAGILRAGSLEEMREKDFELVTSVNYTAYFLCAKHASAIMKIQHKYKPDHFMDIIQINSKSGLKGSNKNFAYAGGKFGGIGLTQSFAMELIPYNIKVNSICPGNFFDGPLWSDPQKGLFVQYLKTGKVKGAKNIGDVRRYYESLVPAGRGCEVQDVTRAIYYLIEQLYETGQALPVTGGQEMLR